MPRLLMPVRLPPGRLKLVTRPRSTGSTPISKMIGIVEVAFFAASAAGRHHPPAHLPAALQVAQCRACLVGRPPLNRDRRNLASLDEGEEFYAGVRQLAGRKGEVWGAESGADKLFVLKTE